ncbi:(Fe-S)-binding protein [Pikeienuella piscinae]|uniref:(Fe-S)-binding protein n=1 Tax=Pikeienuella piscinae TaxID=2748098 RepID=A0A7L5BX03_9RHOB|nr:(Fe-S)-binding protein [Pikeienuella piscinae]QIE56272.1 (Fe-S)-binding protein [Pikeienuella piscinae]
MPEPARPRVALFVTCLVDMFRPTIGFAAVGLLTEAGCEVVVPEAQTCCGQPAYNSGDRATTRRIAKGVIAAFEGYDYVVGPSGSCIGTIVKDYPALFDDEPEWAARAKALAAQSYEITAFLTEVMKFIPTDMRFDGRVTYHDSCSGLRGLGVHDQPRALLAAVEGLELIEMKDADVCCGFGGAFCVKYPAISNKMVSDKTANIAATGAETLLAGDLGCLMNMAGKLSREGRPVKARHVIEVLAGMSDRPAIGESEE